MFSHAYGNVADSVSSFVTPSCPIKLPAKQSLGKCLDDFKKKATTLERNIQTTQKQITDIQASIKKIQEDLKTLEEDKEKSASMKFVERTKLAASKKFKQASKTISTGHKNAYDADLKKVNKLIQEYQAYVNNMKE